ncbi:hypothetical protein [Variovorax guangxiensis]|uniref:hypothetical protein n=1 Tax=Variovorax guangxiensis TaxID=1775474 RepID=UPI002857127C|nr:hypothetical protein [Variovorax guangxiensis]MDR6855317.1 hypothetical protein [Variovorax guangxiensis]
MTAAAKTQPKRSMPRRAAAAETPASKRATRRQAAATFTTPPKRSTRGSAAVSQPTPAGPVRLLAKKRRACEILDVSPATLDRWLKDGFLEKVVLGPRHVRVTMASIEALLHQPAAN